MPKPRQPLNELQTEVLLILYKFRFATRDLIVAYQELPSRTYSQVRLANLMQQGYIARRYSGKDKIAGKPASYYLANRGIGFLLDKKVLDEHGLNPKVLNLVYKDKIASESFIEQSFNVFKLYSIFTKLYGDNMELFTASETLGSDLFIKPLPHAYITFSGRYGHKPDYFLELMTSDKSYFIHRRRLNQYFKQYAGNSWQKQTKTNYPNLLLVADSPNLERRLQKSAAFSLNSRSMTDLKVRTTTLKALLTATGPKDKICSDALKSETLIAL